MFRAYRRDAAVVFVLLAFAFGYFYQDAGANGNSRFDLIFAAVQEGRLYIDSFHNREETQTIDQAYYAGHYYSDKAVGPSAAGALLYLPMYAIQRLAHLPDLKTVKMLLTFLVIGLPAAAAGSLVYLLARHWSQSRGKAFLVTAAIALGTMYWPYSVVFFSHQFTSALLVAAFFLIYLLKETPTRLGDRYLLLVGLLMGWALISEFPAAVIVLALAGYYLLAVGRRPEYRSWRALLLPGLGGLPPVLLQLAYNRACFGNFFSIGYANLNNPEFGPAMQQGLMGIQHPNWHALFYMTFHPTLGLFWQSPVLLLSVFGAAALLWNRARRAELALSVLVIGAYSVMMSGYYMWWGGWALGARHIIPILPFFCLLLAFVPRRLDALLAVLCTVSVGQMLIAAASDVQVPDGMVRQIRTLGFFEYSNIYSYCLERLRQGYFAENLGHLLFGLSSWASLLPLLAGEAGITAFLFRGEEWMRGARERFSGRMPAH
jgi:hypothetical protein